MIDNWVSKLYVIIASYIHYSPVLDQIQEIKDRLDITDVVSSYVKLKKAGRNSFGLCPFHSEKTPSFSVNSELGVFKCFGCGESGDVISFIQKIENTDFPQALELAAQRAGITLTKNKSRDDKYSKEKDALLKLNSFVAEFYNYVLTKHASGKAGKAYLEKRDINSNLIEEFKIGYAPKGYDNIKKILLKRSYTENDLIRWGILAERTQSYDKFRQRIIFPVFDHYGNIVGFSGRTIVPDFQGPKYLNSPETIVYKKSKLLFGLYNAKDAIKKNGFVILTEGQIDVISSHKAGIENIVAPLGTALTEDQLKLLKRYSSKIYMGFDMDQAGEKACIKGVEMATQLDFEVFGLNLKNYKDIDEMIQSDKEEWKSTVLNEMDIVSYLIFRVSKRVNVSTLTGKLEVANIILPIIKKIPDGIKRDYYLKDLSSKIEVDIDVLYKETGNAKQATSVNKDQQTVAINVKQKVEMEDYLIALLIQNYKQVKRLIKLINADELDILENRKIFMALQKYILGVKDTNVKTFMASLSLDLQEKTNNLVLSKIPEFEDSLDLKAEIERTITNIKRNHLRKEIDVLQQKIKQAENISDQGEIDRMERNLSEMLKGLNK